MVVVSTDGFVEAGAVTLLRASFARLQSVVRFGDTDIDVRCSGGAAVWPSDSRDFHEVLQLADLALYKAKSRGKSRLQFYDTDILNERHKVLALRERLRARCATASSASTGSRRSTSSMAIPPRRKR